MKYTVKENPFGISFYLGQTKVLVALLPGFAIKRLRKATEEKHFNQISIDKDYNPMVIQLSFLIILNFNTSISAVLEQQLQKATSIKYYRSLNILQNVIH